MSESAKPNDPSKPPAKRELKPGLGEVMGVAAGLSPLPTQETYAPPISAPTTPPAAVSLDLERRLRSPRTLVNALFSLVVAAMAMSAMVPLFSVLAMLIYQGGQRISLELFTDLPPAAGMTGGGVGNAFLGTLLMVGIASFIAVPVGILGAVYTAEFGPHTSLASIVRFCVKVLSGLPSVLAGLFAYASVVLLTGHYSAIAGGVALSILMLPTVLLTAEQAIKMVPNRMRDAAIGMGANPTQVTLHIVLPTAMPGILTGVMLAVARAAGETAPLLFTALFSDYWLTRNPMEPTPSLAVLIFDFSSSPFGNQVQIAWAASLILVLLVLFANIAAQIWTARSHRA
jgi:phosphate transport system permease protein